MYDTFMFPSDDQTPGKECIKVIGIGGGGGNALNNIIKSGIAEVEFIAANTDMTALSISEAPSKLILGKELTRGRGAGSSPEIGRKAAEESKEELSKLLDGADMVFITAGMGGGTGTGASPVVAGVAKDMGALVVGIVTIPFAWEGRRRMSQALEGIKNLREQVDALIVIENERLLEVAEKSIILTDAFRLADDVLRQAVEGVTDTIHRCAQVNVDFADISAILRGSGAAIMGIGEGRGDGRAIMAAKAAINSPLMTIPIDGAKGVLYFIVGGPDLGLHELHEAASLIKTAAHEEANIIWGWSADPELGDTVRITVIAAGFSTTPLTQTAQNQNFGGHHTYGGRGIPQNIPQRPQPYDEAPVGTDGLESQPYGVPQRQRYTREQPHSMSQHPTGYHRPQPQPQQQSRQPQPEAAHPQPPVQPQPKPQSGGISARFKNLIGRLESADLVEDEIDQQNGKNDIEIPPYMRKTRYGK